MPSESWLGTLKAFVWKRTDATADRRPRRWRAPRLEALEDRLTPALITLASFDGDNGAYPTGRLVEDSSGNLFGTTTDGGVGGPGLDLADGLGTVFEVAHGSGSVTTLAFFSGANGANPAGGLVMDGDGNLFGTTAFGGAGSNIGAGTVFELPHGGSTVTTLAAFNVLNGIAPARNLIADSSGNLFGTTEDLGLRGGGTVFEVAHGSGAITVLAYLDASTGSAPIAGLIMDASGNLFGTTTAGGAHGNGTVFEVAHDSGAITVLASFDSASGFLSHSGLVMDGDDNLFGTTEAGGALNVGAVFELARGSGTITTLASFDGSDGKYPFAGLVMDARGNLFGTTEGGGANDKGTVFEVAHGSGAIITLASFDGDNGVSPTGELIMDASGNLFGTTEGGGANDKGTVFEVPADVTPPTTTATLRASGRNERFGTEAATW